MKTNYDVIIVGGRVAGAVLATRLGQLGHKVLVLEKARFPKDTLSTSFFRTPALSIFEKIGVLDQITNSAPPLRVLWNYIDGQVISDFVEAEEEHLRFFISQRRITLDWILYQRLKQEANVEIRLGVNVRDLLWENGSVVGVKWKENDRIHEVTSKVVVGADGYYSTLAQLLQPAYESYTPVQRFIYYAYFHHLDSFDVPTAEHHFVGNTISYIFPTDGDLTMAAMTKPIAEFSEFKKAPLRNFMEHLGSLPLFKARFEHAELASPIYGSGNIPSYQRMPFGPGWVLVGDAHQVMDPWSGMGIDHATTHADYLAEALNVWLKEYSSWKVTMFDYYLRIRKFSEKAYRRTTRFASDLRPMTIAALERRSLVTALTMPTPVRN